MKRIEPESVGDVLRDLFRQTCMEDRLDERRAIDLWQPIVGEAISRRCRQPRIANGIMTVGVYDPALRHELTMTRSILKNVINSKLGKEIIKDIRFVS